MALIETNKRLYELTFNPELDVYEDESPIKKYERNTTEFICLCKINSPFITYSQYNKHINLDIHKRYKDNFKFFNKPLLDCRGLVIDLKRENHKLENRYLGMKQKYKGSKKDVSEISELKERIKELENINKELNEKLYSIENCSSSDEDIIFDDCQ